MNDKTLTNKERKIGFQGDLMIRPARTVPEGFKPTSDMICAHSETGHHHVAEGAVGRYVSADDPESLIAYLVVQGTARIVHHREHPAPHETVALDEGVWEIVNQVEFDPYEGWRRAAD